MKKIFFLAAGAGFMALAIATCVQGTQQASQLQAEKSTIVVPDWRLVGTLENSAGQPAVALWFNRLTRTCLAVGVDGTVTKLWDSDCEE